MFDWYRLFELPIIPRRPLSSVQAWLILPSHKEIFTICFTYYFWKSYSKIYELVRCIVKVLGLVLAITWLDHSLSYALCQLACKRVFKTHSTLESSTAFFLPTIIIKQVWLDVFKLNCWCFRFSFNLIVPFTRMYDFITLLVSRAHLFHLKTWKFWIFFTLQKSKFDL